MKTHLVLIALIAGASAMAQEEQEIPAPPPVTVQPEAASVTLLPINLSLLSVGISSLDPASLRVVLSGMTPEQLARVIVVLQKSPNALQLVIAQMSAAQLQTAIGRLTPTQLTAVVAVLVAQPETLRTFLQQLSADSRLTILKSPGFDVPTLKLLMSIMTSAKLPLPKVAAIGDINRWGEVLAWLADTPKTRNWVAVEKERLSAMIQKSGCTPEILARAEAAKSRTQ